jgi:hypothetical protein
MNKLIIARRTNWESKFYVKIKATKNCMKLIRKIIDELGEDFFVDNPTLPRRLSNYERWKDIWIPVATKKFGAEVICGNKMIHFIFYKFPNFESVNVILDKYCTWAEVKCKK